MPLLNAILQNDAVKVLVLDNHKTAFEYIKEPNTIIAIFAIIVSLLGLWISVRYNRKTLEHTIKHSKLSVEPILTIQTLNYLDDNFIAVKLQNKGLGTAIITSTIYKYLNNEYVNFDSLLKDNYFTNYKFEIEDSIIETFNYTNTTHLSSNEEVILCSFKAVTEEKLEPFTKILIDTKVIIEYKSMYGEKKRLHNNKLLS